MTALHDLYKDLHQHPELSFAERHTAGVIAGVRALTTAALEWLNAK